MNTSIEAVAFAVRVPLEEAPKIQTVKSTACASKKNKTFHRKAFFAAVHTSTHLFDTCDPMKVPRPLVALLLPKILIRLGCGVTIKTITILSSSFLLSKVTSGLSDWVLLDASTQFQNLKVSEELIWA